MASLPQSADMGVIVQATTEVWVWFSYVPHELFFVFMNAIVLRNREAYLVPAGHNQPILGRGCILESNHGSSLLHWRG